MNPVNSNAIRTLGHFVFGTLAFSIIYRFISTSLVHQLVQPVFIYPHVDLMYWLMHLIKIPEFISRNKYISVLFDLVLFFSIIISAFDARKRWACFIAFLFYFLYIIIYNTYSLHHTHPMIGGIVVAIPFLFKKEKDFKLLWEGVRYYALWVYGSAFIWKLFRGTFFHLEHGEATFKAMHTTYLVNNPNTLLAQSIEWFIQNPMMAHLFLVLGFVLQGSFLIGFVTKKLDWLWFILPFIFHLTTHFFIEVAFFELLILNLAFIPLEKWNNVSLAKMNI